MDLLSAIFSVKVDQSTVKENAILISKQHQGEKPIIPIRSNKFRPLPSQAK
jgi:hypothetical protein